jgi:formate hydrogenlyase subunit 6/NADH:ubiquinone oxidoreductase subunit I
VKIPGRIIWEVLGSIFKKPNTVLYPLFKVPKPPKTRGRITFFPEKCINCGMCMKDCPSKAITITKVGEKQFECDIDLGKCVYCAQCVDSCFKKALEATPDFELAQLDKKKLKVHYASQGPDKEPEKQD